jgi:hypothetical protein
MGLQAISTDQDTNTDGEGFLQAHPAQLKVFIKNFRVCLFGDFALQDLECKPDSPLIHCAPAAIEGSFKVFIKNIGVHRHGDLRACEATTIAFPFNSKVFAG